MCHFKTAVRVYIGKNWCPGTEKKGVGEFVGVRCVVVMCGGGV